jgi:hypothetical protein
MRHLVYMRTPVRVGVADGAIDVTSMVVGKVSELGHGEVSLRCGAMLRKLARPCELPAVECRRTALPRDPERPSIEVRDSEAGTLRFQTAHVLLLPRRGNDPQRRSLAPPLISGPGIAACPGSPNVHFRALAAFRHGN